MTKTITEIAKPAIVAPENMTAAELRIEATRLNMQASRSSSLDLREFCTAKATVYRAAADARA